jgi:hypothetical protein
MSYGFDTGSLRESIEEIGLVHPPCIAGNREGRIDVVTGYRRILALKQLGWEKVGCEDLTLVLGSSLERLLFAFHENRASRTFNPVEKGMILKRLSELLDQETVLKRFMPLLQLPSHPGILEFYTNLEGTKYDFRAAVAGGRLSIGSAKSLMDLEPDFADCAFNIIEALMLNFNQQSQFIEIMDDIADKEGRTPVQILEENPIRDVLESTALNKPQKAKRLLDELRSRRYPRWRRAEKRFKEKLGCLVLPERTRIDHPAYFEAPGYRLEMEFQHGDELMEKLRRLADLPAIRELGDPADDK